MYCSRTTWFWGRFRAFWWDFLLQAYKAYITTKTNTIITRYLLFLWDFIESFTRHSALLCSVEHIVAYFLCDLLNATAKNISALFFFFNKNILLVASPAVWWFCSFFLTCLCLEILHCVAWCPWNHPRTGISKVLMHCTVYSISADLLINSDTY